MEQIVWILLVLLCGTVFWLPVLGSCPYNGTGCICSRESLVCTKVSGIPALVLDNGDDNITELTFKSCRIDTIDENSLPSNLHKLTFSTANIAKISPEAFSGSSTTLKSFTVYNVTYPEMPPEALLKITNLTELQLSFTKIANWNIAVLLHLGKTIRSLVVREVGFMVLPEWIKYFTKLNSVDMSDGKFIELSFDDFRNARHLTNLNVGRHQIATVTCTEDTTFTNTLEILSLSSNRLQTIPSCVSRMSKLSIFRCSFNLISTLTPERMPLQLKELELEFNRILNLNDSSFQNLSSLEIVSFEFNAINYISPLAFQPLENLRVLDLRYTTLVRIPVGLTKLTRLEILNMKYIDTLKCEYPVDEELVIWYKSLNNTKIHGKCSNSKMSIECYLSNDKHSPECSGSNQIEFNVLPYVFCVCLFCKMCYTFGAC